MIKVIMTATDMTAVHGILFVDNLEESFLSEYSYSYYTQEIHGADDVI